MARQAHKKKRGKRRRWLVWLGGVLLVVLIAAAGYGIYLYDKLQDTVNEIHEPLSDEQQSEETGSNGQTGNDDQNADGHSNYSDSTDPDNKKETLNFLLLGVDERANDQGRSDTMILVSANPNTDSMLMMSIPRDTYTEIPGKGMDKINHAYAFGGTSLAVKTVKQTFDVPIDFYIKVNMEGFRDGIDALNGITVENSFGFTQDGKNFPEGEINLNGEEALAYTRMRKKDPQGDLGRNERQRQVIQAALDQAANFSNFTKIGRILDIVGGNVRTNMKMENMRNVYSHYRQTRKTILSLEIDGSGKIMEDGIWYYMVTNQELARLNAELVEHMEAR
ncbi:LCP family glycopolymer transferase [Sediminibacillus dalangtanensis]|uniref:LCP family glycopolymer transferase n=1 Tax=Sediminibacillus dalangtanensis TaxID=2729421 RepID=UPI001FD7CBB7|nr:LCP family protein [Sediminibacillus dalangtanensis]